VRVDRRPRRIRQSEQRHTQPPMIHAPVNQENRAHSTC
jgi:hypothetical protein